MIILLVLGAVYPSLIVYRRIKKCYSKCKNKSNNADITTAESKWTSKKARTDESVNIDIPVEKLEFQRPGQADEEWTPPPPPTDFTQDQMYPDVSQYEPGLSPEEARYLDLRDSKILSVFDELKTKYETEQEKAD